MNKIETFQMSEIEGGSWKCAGNVALAVLAGASVVVATGGWAVVAGFAYIVQLRDTSNACFGD